MKTIAVCFAIAMAKRNMMLLIDGCGMGSTSFNHRSF